MFLLRQLFFLQMFNAIFQLYQDEEAMEYLKEIGPDTLVPCFTVNLKDNRSIDGCNAINMAIFQKLIHSSGERTAHRVPMVVTASSMLHHKHSSALKSFKKRLGVSGATIDRPLTTNKTSSVVRPSLVGLITKHEHFLIPIYIYFLIHMTNCPIASCLSMVLPRIFST